MELLTAGLRASLPPLYSQEHSQDPVVHCKFFTPWSNWTWFVTEGCAVFRGHQPLPARARPVETLRE